MVDRVLDHFVARRFLHDLASGLQSPPGLQVRIGSLLQRCLRLCRRTVKRLDQRPGRFVGRPLKVPAVRRVTPASKTKFAHLIRVTHRDQVEAPITDWLREAFEFVGETASKPSPKPTAAKAAGRATATAKRGMKASASVVKQKRAKPHLTKQVKKKTRR